MGKSGRDVTDAELAVLQVLWTEGERTIRQITDVLYPKGGSSEYATVQKLLERLEGKECVNRRRTESVHVFTPAIDREELIGRRLADVADKLCDGSLTPLLTHLVKKHGTSAAQRAALKKLADQLLNEAGGTRKPRKEAQS